MTPTTTAGEKLRHLLSKPGIKIAPAVYDCLGAKIAEQVGFELVFSGGFGIAATLLGKPDLGYVTATEMVATAKRIASAVSLPLIADMDTGYGNPLNVIRTVEDAVVAGVGGIILEDQEWPKKCGHMEDKKVVSVATHEEKIKAAVFARQNSGLVIVARTDARAVNGIEDALIRGERYIAAGADVLFVEAPQTVAELQAIAQRFPHTPLLANIVEGGKTPNLTADELAAMGYRIVIFALSGLFAATEAIQHCFSHLKAHGSTVALEQKIGFKEFAAIIDLDQHQRLAKRFHA